jgi:hypothetical protein
MSGKVGLCTGAEHGNQWEKWEGTAACPNRGERARNMEHTGNIHGVRIGKTKGNESKEK